MSANGHDNTLPLFGPGSQPRESDGANLDILQLPDEMQTYQAPDLPEPEDASGMQSALAMLHQMQRDMQRYRDDQEVRHYDLSTLDAANRHFVEQVLGEGEVSIIFDGDSSDELNIQESAMAGLWRIKGKQRGELLVDALEVGPVPAVIRNATFADAQLQIDDNTLEVGEGVCNALPLIAEINLHCHCAEEAHTPHVINLTLLPQSEADLFFLQHSLGHGKTRILSRGYGNCRINSTNTRNVWWVQYFNSQDKNILNTLEITAVPEAARAAREDIADSAIRLAEILEIYA